MANKLLTRKEVQKRVAETFAEILASWFSISAKEAIEEFDAWTRRAATSDENALAIGVMIHLLGKNIRAGFKKNPSRRYPEQEIEAKLAQAKAQAAEMTPAIRKGVRELLRKIPRRGGPGRSEALNATEKREVCEQIGTVYKMGKIKKWPDIFEAVAETFRAKGKKVSARTIKRVWQARETLYVG